MIRAERIYTQELIKKVMNHPRNLKAIRGENAVDADWPIVDQIIYLGMFEDDIIGLFIGFTKSDIVLDVHVAMLPEFYKHTDECYTIAIDWVKQNTEFKKLVGQTPSFNKLAIKCNERNGMVREGVNKQSYLRNGRLYDQIYFGRVL